MLVSHGYRSRGVTQNLILLANSYSVPSLANHPDLSTFLAVPAPIAIIDRFKTIYQWYQGSKYLAYHGFWRIVRP
jgi:hypothetical protein